jgi:hypothetical protein
MDRFVWVGDEGPDWMHGGSYVVLRRIRIALEHWDRMPLEFQEQSVGRHKNSGAPLGRDNEFDPPDLTATGNDGDLLIPESAHIRLAAAASNEGAQILRRPYSYNDGVDFTIERWPPWRRGVEYDAGLLFVCYQRDYGGEDSAILPPSAIPQYRPRRCKPTATLEEPGSVEWLIAQSEGVRRSMSMKKRAEPQHADPSQAIGARKSGDNPSFTASAYWKFESTPLQRTVRVSHRPSRCRSRTARVARVCAAGLAARSAETRTCSSRSAQSVLISLSGHIPVPQRR